VFVKIVPNTKYGKSVSTFSAVLDTLPNVPEHDRIYKDCPYESCLIILCSYVDDILAFTKCQSLAGDFLAHCNKRFTMTCDGEAHWYLSVKYTRDPSGAVSASQELYIDKILKRMFYERDILEGLTKKTFYDSPRIVLTDLEQSLLEKTSTSLV
jgi:hypothetical protein